MTTMVESSRQSNSLPSISHLEPHKTRREDLYKQRPASQLPALFRFDNPSHDKTSPVSQKHAAEPQRSTVEETRATAAVPVRQSLPSISEALGRDPSRSFHGPPPPTPPAAASSSSYFTQPSTTASVLNTSRRSSPSTYPPGSGSTAHVHPPTLSRRSSFTNTTLPLQNPKVPVIQPIQTGHSPTYAYARSSGQYTPTTYSPSPQSAPAHATYPYSSQQPQYHHPHGSAPHGSHASILSAPPQPTPWTGETGGKSPTRSGRAHDSSVKRELDQFDLEASFYELNTNGKRICDFGESGGREVRRVKMNGNLAVHVPTPEEIEAVSEYMANMQRAFHRIQEISHAHHAELQEQQKELRRQYEGMAAEHNEYMQDGSGGLPSDAKKRRGRAAPPGRCHSCNRAETPEWRRGPDGARTLCNACGLHYAKLTRKMGPQQKAGISSSNLRPKGV